MKSLRLSLLLCSALGFWAPCAFSQTTTVPTLLSYQGLLTDSAGNLIGAAAPVAVFATPGKPSVLVPEGCKVPRLAAVGDDIDAAQGAGSFLQDVWNAGGQ